MLLHDESPATVESRDEDFLLSTYARTKFHPRRGRGARLFDEQGRAWWDLLSGIGVNVLGHGHPAIRRAMREAAAEPLHLSNLYHHPWQGLLAERLISLSRMSKVFFCNSGTEANEAALKFARLCRPGRSKVVAIEGSFHGRTFGSLSVTGNEGYRKPFAPLMDGEVVFVRPDDLQGLRRAIDGNTSAVIVEPLQGEGGVVPLSSEFLQTASTLAHQAGAALICDEIQCGFGRTGHFFAYERAGIEPDIVTLAKPLGGGLPLGAVIVTSRVAGHVEPGMHGTTFGGNPVACRLGLAVVQTIVMERMLPEIERCGDWLAESLDGMVGRSGVTAVRGAGLMWGIELDRPAAPVAAELFNRGFLVGTARERVVRLLPPYIVPRRALREFVTVFDTVLKETRT